MNWTENKNDNIYKRMNEGECVQTAKLHLLGIGKYGFKTSSFGEKTYELNMNMPLFDTKDEAYQWINNTGKWICVSE